MPRDNKFKQSLPPIINQQTKIMVIGSMPGEISLRQQQYYAHPQNNFWKFIAKFFPKITLNLDYKSKTQKLLQRNIGLWDSLKFCKREGSSDSKIQDITPNDFTILNKQAPLLQKLLFNGKKSYETFLKSPNCQWAKDKKIEMILMPSTSPANASQSLAWKESVWQEKLSDNELKVKYETSEKTINMAKK